jgi:EAL domain-containing protein (putative c-di-GMP-specific phosphodiesterase class I)
MVRTILSLAENLGVDVIAEGIENDTQAEHLLEMGCNKHQGFRFSKPLPLDEAQALVNEGPSGAFRTLGGDHR